jgi:predicted RND superfamily exporter protein
MKKTEFEIDNHSGIDKDFGFGNEYIFMLVDYDDVNHKEVDIAITYIKDILNKHWNDEEFKMRLGNI